jgi:hypothetical protein
MSSIPTSVDEFIRSKQNNTSSELAQSATSVDINLSTGLLNSSSNASIRVKENRANVPRSSSIVTTCSSSRPILPYVTHYSDSGFSSTLSSGSSCSYLPPPPPYRVRSGTTNSEDIERSMAAAVEGLTRRRQHKIHRSLSDSKYGTSVINDLSNINRNQIHRNQQPKSNSTTNCVVTSYNSVAPGRQNASNEHFSSNRDSSWTTSRLSLVCTFFLSSSSSDIHPLQFYFSYLQK